MPPFSRAIGARDASHWAGRDLGSLFADTVSRLGDRLALIDGPLRLRFDQLDAASAALASGLGRLGVAAGDVVAYQLPNWWEAAAAFLATARLGAIANPLLPSFRERELTFTLAESGARVIFLPAILRGCDHRLLLDGLRASLPRLEHVVVCRGERGAGSAVFEDLAAAPPAAPPAVDPRSLLLLMYTSGTTAAPKGVLHTHDTLVAEILSLARVHQLGPGDCALVPSPVTHISGVIHAILTPAILGTSAVLMDRWEPLEGLRLIAAERVTYMAGAPTFLQDLAQHAGAGSFDTASLRLFSCGGAAVSPALVRLARERLPGCVAKRVYGSTEFPTLSTTGADDAVTHGIETEGRAIAPAEIRIIRQDGTAAAAGEEGEVQARGPECFVGYSDAALNAESFTADGWFRTGDLGRLDGAGYLRITGRLKEIVVRKGEKISVREVEEAVATHPAIAEVAVVAVPDTDTGERACAVVVLKPEGSLTLVELSAFLAAGGLARHKHPERLDVVAALPHTESGKIARDDLRRFLQR